MGTSPISLSLLIREKDTGKLLESLADKGVKLKLEDTSTRFFLDAINSITYTGTETTLKGIVEPLTTEDENAVLLYKGFAGLLSEISFLNAEIESLKGM